MKKLSIFLIITLFLTVMSSCGDSADGSSVVSVGNNPYFIAEVSEVGKSYVILEVTDSGRSGITVGSEVSVNPEHELGDNAPELDVGDEVRVEFSGEVREMYPLSLTKVYSIDKID